MNSVKTPKKVVYEAKKSCESVPAVCLADLVLRSLPSAAGPDSMNC